MSEPDGSERQANEREGQMAAGRDIDPRLLEMIVCPQTRSRLIYDGEAHELISPAAGLAYPVRDGIPIMLVDEARTLSESEKARHKAASGPA